MVKIGSAEIEEVHLHEDRMEEILNTSERIVKSTIRISAVNIYMAFGMVCFGVYAVLILNPTNFYMEVFHLFFAVYGTYSWARSKTGNERAKERLKEISVNRLTLKELREKKDD